jgi:hypothetical protein
MSGERFWFEDVPEEYRYWFLAPKSLPGNMPREPEGDSETEHSVLSEEQAQSEQERINETLRRAEEVDFGINSLDIPWWTDVLAWEREEEVEYNRIPKIFTKRDWAEAEEGDEEAPGARLGSVPYEAFWVDQGTLLDKLIDADFLCVMVDGKIRLRSDFIEELYQEEDGDQA